MEGRPSRERGGAEAAIFIGLVTAFQLLNFVDSVPRDSRLQMYTNTIMQIESTANERLLYYEK